MKVTVTFCLVLICSLSQISTAVAETIDCGSGDVQCLIAAINQANANPNKTTIRLAGGTYLLTSRRQRYEWIKWSSVDRESCHDQELPVYGATLERGGHTRKSHFDFFTSVPLVSSRWTGSL